MDQAPLLAELLQQEHVPGIETLLRYLMAADSSLDLEKVSRAISTESDEIKSRIMSLGEKLIERGRQEGRQEGRREGVHAGGLVGEIRTLQRVLGLPISSPEELSGRPEEELDRLAGQLRQRLAVPAVPSRPHIQLLSDSKFWAAYLPLCAVIKDAPVKLRREMHGELDHLDNILRSALEARWGKSDAYYEVSDDWSISWHHSMAVCSDQMCCGEFLDIVQRALARIKHDWCFHVSLECTEDMGWGLQRAGRGQIFFYRGCVFGNRKDKFDYKLFERAPPGCRSAR